MGGGLGNMSLAHSHGVFAHVGLNAGGGKSLRELAGKLAEGHVLDCGQGRRGDFRRVGREPNHILARRIHRADLVFFPCGRRSLRRRLAHLFFPIHCQGVELRRVATDAKTAIAAEDSFTVEYRQAG